MLKGLLVLLLLTLVSADRQLKFVQAIWRHGDRAPLGQPYPNDPYKEAAWPRGWGELTSIGMEQHNELGQFFRKRYGDFINASYIPSQAYMRSSDTDRALASAQAFLSGMYPASGDSQWSPGNPWQPIPVHGATAGENDWLCKSTSVNCPNYNVIYDADEQKDAQFYMNEYADFFAFLAQQNTTGNTNFTYTDVNGIYDITRELTHNLSDLQPDWVYKQWQQYSGRTTLDIGSDLRGVRYFNQWGTRQKGQFFGGYLLNNFITNAQIVAAGNQKNPDRMLWYSSHDTVVSSLMYTMDLGNEEMPPYAACLFMEVFNNNGSYETEFFYRNRSDVPPFRLTIPGCSNPCPVTQLADIYKDVVFTTTDAALQHCGVLTQQQCSQPGGSGSTVGLWLSISTTVALMFL